VAPAERASIQQESAPPIAAAPADATAVETPSPDPAVAVGIAAAPGSVAAPAGAPRSRVAFTGAGSEYFRIWVVNLLLTLATLGIYSAWAKVRKTRYFYQNTRLEGHAFDYHGAPLAILRGRVVAVVLLLAYTWSFDISRTVGLVTIGVLCLAGPWLFMKAQQFRFRNSSWRGLRFGFNADLIASYRTLLPLLLLWFSGTILGALVVPALVIAVAGAATGLLIPAMHHALKRYQHTRITYGDVGATFRPALKRFYGTYFKGMLVLFASSLVGWLLATGLTLAVTALRGPIDFGNQSARTAALLAGGLVVSIAYLGAWPFFAARLQQTVWGNSALGPVGFETHIRAWPLLRLVLRCVMLTVLTLGLYWPFAAVALARYRIENMEVIAPAALNDTVAAVTARTDATGEGTADFFGLDVGL
jgi:uncharacterized membrane protein YjgN (DUF898 family)